MLLNVVNPGQMGQMWLILEKIWWDAVNPRTQAVKTYLSKRFEMWEDVAKCGEMWLILEKCGQMWLILQKCGEMLLIRARE